MVTRLTSAKPSHSLTQRQQEILAFIERHQEDSGRPPTRNDIADHFGFTSRSSAQEHIAALERLGMLKRTPGSRGVVVLATQAPSRPGKGLLRLPIIGRVRAGGPSLAIEDQEGDIDLPATLFHTRPDLVLRVFGDSMRDAGIVDGDLVAVQYAHDARNGQIVVARIDSDITIKFYSRRAGRIVLTPANHEYKPLEIKPGQSDFSVVAVVVGVVRRYT